VPVSVECVQQEGNNNETGPLKSIIKYEFPARPFKEPYSQVKWYGKTLPPITVYWYDGGFLPPRPEGTPETEVLGDLGEKGENGSYFVGERGIVTTGCYGGGTRLVPSSLMADFKKPDPFIPRIEREDSRQEWIRACKGGPAAGSNFDYAGPFTEVVLLGNLAIRSGQKLEYDSANMRITNVPEANQLLHREYRKGWSL